MEKLTFNHEANTLPEVLGFKDREEMLAAVMANGAESGLSIAVGLATIFFNDKSEKFALMLGGILSVMYDERLDQPSKAIEFIYNTCDTPEKVRQMQGFIVAFHEVYLEEDIDAMHKRAEARTKPTSIKDLQAMFEKDRKTKGE